MWWLFKHNHYSIVKDIVYTQNFEIYHDNNQVWQLFKVRYLISKYGIVFK